MNHIHSSLALCAIYDDAKLFSDDIQRYHKIITIIPMYITGIRTYTNTYVSMALRRYIDFVFNITLNLNIVWENVFIQKKTTTTITCCKKNTVKLKYFCYC